MSLSTTQWGLSTVLSASIQAEATGLKISVVNAAAFHPAPGTHYYLTLRADGRREVVRVVGAAGTTLVVQRGQDGTAASWWPQGACLSVEWNPQQLREFIEQVGAGTEPTGVVPGTYCLDCTSCLSVNAAGQITSINGAGGCP